MQRLPGDDLINVYSGLSKDQKRDIASEIVKIQTATTHLPDGAAFGFASSYEQAPPFASWFDFLTHRLEYSLSIIKRTAVFNENQISEAVLMINNMKDDLLTVKPRPFMWDTSERNVIIYEAKISGIVDVDDICFGDPLFVLALTYAALELYGHDTVYPDYWAELLMLDKKARKRIDLYRLLYTVWFMRKHTLQSTNNQTILLDVKRLEDMFQRAVARIKD
jgi:hypothetical protein